MKTTLGISRLRVRGSDSGSGQDFRVWALARLKAMQVSKVSMSLSTCRFAQGISGYC